ncbi:MAG: hypothetical protein ACK5L5_09155 [Bacteroidales bacterium]
MRYIKKIQLLTSCIAVLGLMWACQEPDENFVHDTNVISSMMCFSSAETMQYNGEIHEYDKDGNIIPADSITQARAEGGYGLILFRIPTTVSEELVLSDVQLAAAVSFDEMITPSLSGRHNIGTEEGIIITVTSGVGTTRQYRIRGMYE